ncbi:MAG: hypothetical protein OWU84_13865 [Firmicutes bacterium]|nr:hypothetical protein [Bacillota bacterium]
MHTLRVSSLVLAAGLIGSSVMAMPVQAARTPPILSELQLSLLMQHPQTYVGDLINLTGQVLYTNNGVTLATVNPPAVSELVALIGLPHWKVGTYFAFTGPLQRVLAASPKLHIPRPIPVIIAQWWRTIPASLALDPILATAPAVAPQREYGLTIRVSRVQYALHQTRIWLSADNQSDQTIEIYDNLATLAQGTHQFTLSPESTFFPSEVAPGVIVHDELIFGPAEMNGVPLRLRFSAFGSNLEENWHAVQFIVPTPKM